MDHKISKDMISSGMIPSGEKTQADLGKTQYGSAPSPSKLMDAYKSMYEKKEEVVNEHHKKDADGNTIPHDEDIKVVEAINLGKPFGAGSAVKPSETPKVGKVTTYRKDPKTGKLIKSEPKEDPMGKEKQYGFSQGEYQVNKQGHGREKKGYKDTRYEGVDLYDILREKFLEEGYDEKTVNYIMVELSDDIRNLSEEPISLMIGGLLAKGAAVAAKGAAVAGKVATGAAKVASAAKKGIVSAAKPVVNAAKNVVKPQPKITSSGGNIVQGSSNTGKNKIIDFAKRETGNMAKQELMKDRPVGKTNKTKLASAGQTDIAASADLFDIVKGKLLDEGLSEKEIKDIMLSLTPDEIMEELSDTVKRNDALNKERAMQAAQDRKVPENVRAAQRRQNTAGGPKDTGENKYTTQDKKTIIDYHKNK